MGVTAVESVVNGPIDPSAETVLEAEWPRRLDGQKDFYPKITLYGSPGSGRTTLSATAPRPFFMNCDPEGLIGISNSGHLWWDIKNIGDMRQCWNWLVNNHTEYDTIVVDTLTNLQILGMDEIVEPAEFVLGKNIWGQSFRQMRSVILGLCAFVNHNVVFICTDRMRDDEITSLKTLVPDVPPSQFKLLNINTRLIAHLGIYRQKDEDGQMVSNRWLQTYNDGRKICKDTSGRLPQMIFVPPPQDHVAGVGLLTEIFATMRGQPLKEESME